MWDGELIVHIDKAVDLKAADVGGTSDPYVALTIEANGKSLGKYKTKTLNKTLNPIWKQDLDLVSLKADGPLKLTFDVYDQDPMADDHLGAFSLNLDSPPHEVIAKTEPLKGKHSKGTLTFSILYVPRREPELKESNSDKYEFPNGKKLTLECGPILLFRGSKKQDSASIHRVGLLVVAGHDGKKPDLSISPPPFGNKVEVRNVWTVGKKTVWVYDFGIAKSSKPTFVNYSIGGKKAEFWVPSKKETPRFAVCSCNGFMHEAPWKVTDEYLLKIKLKQEKNYMWKRMLEEHSEKHFHVLIQGGDQVYCDPFWTELPELAQYKGLGDKNILQAKVTESITQKLDEFYMRIYVESWNLPWISDVLARVPSVMMWDDHDIMDGWGSFDDALLQSEIARAAFGAAERSFLAFQQGGNLENVPYNMKGNFKGHHHLCITNKVGIASVDIRTERTKQRVLANESYEAIFGWLDDHAQKMDHLILVSSIPAIYNDFAFLEKMIKGRGVGIEDDLIDHWRSSYHNKERVEFIRKMFDWAHKSSTRVTILSGDVHIGAVGCAIHKQYAAESNAGVMNSLVSSAIVNHPPGNHVVGMLNYNAGAKDHIDSNIVAGLVRFPPDRKDYYIRDRNFLEMIGTTERGFLCQWISEGSNKKAQQRLFKMYIKPFKKDTSADLPLLQEKFKPKEVENIEKKKTISFH